MFFTKEAFEEVRFVTDFFLAVFAYESWKKGLQEKTQEIHGLTWENMGAPVFYIF